MLPSSHGLLALTVTLVALGVAQAELPARPGAYVVAGSLPSPHATQAATADDRHVYAVSSTTVVKYDRATGQELARSIGPAQHLNSAYLFEGKLYCAHSNYPRKPDESDIRVLDPADMKLVVFHKFTDPPGSLTWAVRRGDHWWCHFAHYNDDTARAVLVQYDTRWREIRRWGYPKALVADWEKASLSGGIWHGDHLLATGHDRKVIYRLRVPADGKTVELVEVLAAPFPGQGLAEDTRPGQLVGIDRARLLVLFARPGKP